MGYPMIPAKAISYGGTRALSSIKYIVIHYTGNKGDSARGNCNYFKNSNKRQAGAHFFVDQKGTAIQSIPLNRTAWSVGGFFTKKNGAGAYYKKCLNSNSVSIEMCDCATKDPSVAMTRAVTALVAHIKKQCPNAKTVIRHWDVNGKSCPARMVGKNNAKWSAFKNTITKASAKPKPSGAKRGYGSVFPTGTINAKTGTKTNIKRWQGFLRWAGFYKGALDGSFGPATIRGTKAFQKKVGLKQDGSAGPATIAKAKAYRK